MLKNIYQLTKQLLDSEYPVHIPYTCHLHNLYAGVKKFPSGEKYSITVKNVYLTCHRQKILN